MIRCSSLSSVQQQLADEINQAVSRVLSSHWYILGPEVENFERSFAEYHGLAHAIGVASGTDAIELALRAADIGPGDEVITVAHTAVATVCAIDRAGATPILVDINPLDYTMDPAACRAAITSKTKAIIPVHLYGHPADLFALKSIADQHGLLLIEDCAQAHGARLGDRLVGTFGQMSAFSFYPTKNLGAYGDGGAIITDDSQFAQRLKRLRFYGQSERYRSTERGINSRLDELQAAILSVKLKYLDHHNDARRSSAEFYSRSLRGVNTPRLRTTNGSPAGESPSIHHVYHQYVIRHPHRDHLQQSLRRMDIESQIHYPIPVHQQAAYADLGYAKGSLPVTERIANEILSLPMYPGLSIDELTTVTEAIGAFCAESERRNAA